MENTTAVTEADHNIPDQVQVPESLDCSEQIQPDSVTDNEPVKAVKRRFTSPYLTQPCSDAKRVKVEGAEKDLKAVWCDFYGMSAKFPKDLFVVRTTKDEEDFRSIYLVSPPIKKVLMATNAGRIKIVNTGVKVFKKNGGENFEGIQTIAPFLSSARQITLSLSDLCTFITSSIQNSPSSPVRHVTFDDLAERSSLMHRLTGIMLTEFKPMEKKCEQPSVEIHPVVKEDASK
ncbi:hypothetical protein BASA83_002436 [Batrachochytrium salamandrivorans]|nr:hypothetical protein BASA83_002436 [Batrachochytrium salamandrivorans]